MLFFVVDDGECERWTGCETKGAGVNRDTLLWLSQSGWKNFTKWEKFGIMDIVHKNWECEFLFCKEFFMKKFLSEMGGRIGRVFGKGRVADEGERWDERIVKSKDGDLVEEADRLGIVSFGAESGGRVGSKGQAVEVKRVMPVCVGNFLAREQGQVLQQKMDNYEGCVLLYGASGAGKSMVAAGYAEPYLGKDVYTHIVWVMAESGAPVRDQLWDYGVRAKLTGAESKEQESGLAGVLEKLNNAQTLVVMDGVQAYGQIAPFLDKLDKAKVIVTAVDKASFEGIDAGRQIEVGRVSAQEVKDFATKMGVSAEVMAEGVQEFVDKFGFDVAVLVQAVCGLKVSGVQSLAQYTETLESLLQTTEMVALMADAIQGDNKKEGEVSVGVLKQRYDAVVEDAHKEFLLYCAMTDIQDITVDIFLDLDGKPKEYLSEALKAVLMEPTGFGKMVESLDKAGLLRFVGFGKGVIFVPKTQRQILQWVDAQGVDKIARRVRACVAEQKTKFETKPQMAQFLQACGVVEFAVNRAYGQFVKNGKKIDKGEGDKETSEKHWIEAAACCFWLGDGFVALGAYDQALESYDKSLDMAMAVRGEKHASVAAIYNNCGIVYQEQGEYGQAMRCYQHALEIAKAVWKDGKYPGVVVTYHNNLATLYKAQGNFETMRKHCGEALVIAKTVWGDKHPKVATIYNSMARVYTAQKEHTKAIACYGKALEIAKAAWGGKHPNVAATYYNLAAGHQAEGAYELAMECYGRALCIAAESEVVSHKSPIVMSLVLHMETLLKKKPECKVQLTKKAVQLLKRYEHKPSK